LMCAKQSRTANGTIPGFEAVPVMVWVFPVDVCPYANTEAWYPSRAARTSSLTDESYTCRVVDCGPYTPSSVYWCVLPGTMSVKGLWQMVLPSVAATSQA